MKLNRRGRVLLALVGATAFAAGCEDDSEVAAPAVTAQAPASRPPAPKRQLLEFPRSGNPIVTVKRGERVALYDEPGGEVLEWVHDETEFGSPTVFSVSRERDGWAAVPTAHFENGRLVWIRLDPKRLRADSLHTEIEIDLSDFQATLMYRDRAISTFSISIGMPTAPTPTGSFAVTDTFRGGLNPAYGCCAVALTARQIRLPSGWLGGDRIAIHGTSGALGAEISNGCVRAADEEVNNLIETVPPGTPVTIRG